MGVPKSAFEVRREANLPLTPIEQRALEICERAAAEGRELDSIEDMRIELGALSYSTVPGIMKRLEEKGYITRTIYQRGRVVCIKASGICTLPPKNTALHWRVRTDRVPTPTIQAIAQRAKPLAAMIETEARRLDKPVAEFLMDCVYVGFHEIKRDQEG